MNLPQSSDLDFADITKLLRLLDSSKRPLILAGHGVRLSGAAHLFEELISKLSIPTTNVPGMHSTYYIMIIHFTQRFSRCSCTSTTELCSSKL